MTIIFHSDHFRNMLDAVGQVGTGWSKFTKIQNHFTNFTQNVHKIGVKSPKSLFNNGWSQSTQRRTISLNGTNWSFVFVFVLRGKMVLVLIFGGQKRIWCYCFHLCNYLLRDDYINWHKPVPFSCRHPVTGEFSLPDCRLLNPKKSEKSGESSLLTAGVLM